MGEREEGWRGEVWEGGGKENGVAYSYKHNTLFLGLQLLYSFPCVIEKEVNKIR